MRSLLDEDSEIIKQFDEHQKKNKDQSKKGTGRKARNSGLNRFASLNKFKKYTDEVKKENTAEKTPEKNDTKVAKSGEEKKSNPKKKKAPAKAAEKIVNKSETNVKQRSNKSETKPQQTVTKKAPDTETIHKHSSNNTKNISTTNLKQEKESDKDTLSNEENFVDPTLIRGQKRDILNILFWDCKSSGSLLTKRYSSDYIADQLGVSVSQISTQIHRMRKDGLIEIADYRSGRNGFRQYRIPKKVYDLLMKEEMNETVQFVSSRSSSHSATNSITNDSSSSSKNLNNITTTSEFVNKDWEAIQIPDQLKDDGFSMAHIRQLAHSQIFKPLEVQESLDNFAYDLERGYIKTHSGTVRFLMGVLRKRQVPYISQALIDQEKRELEEYSKKIQEAKESKKLAAEFSLARKFDEWWATLSQKQIAKPSNFIKEGSEIQEKVARGIYLENPDIDQMF